MSEVADDRLVAGIELGGTKCIVVLARAREILESARFPTTDPATTLTALSDSLLGWRDSHGPVTAIGIGSFGPVGLDRARDDYGYITSTPKPGWRNVDLVGHFAALFDVPIGFDTDVAGAALSEYRWGAAQGCDVALYLTVGTGVGAGVVVDGRPVHGLIHPEMGHIRVRRAMGDDFKGACPFHGDCLEGLVAGPAVAARAGRPGADVGDDDPLWGRIADEMAEAMAMLMLTLSPRRILIGGGVFQQRRYLFDRVRDRTADLLAGYVVGVGREQLDEIIGPPGLGDLAGPLGAVALAYSA